MSGHSDLFVASLDARVADIVDACTRCGKCVSACPMPEIAGIDAGDPKAVAGGVIAILSGDGAPRAAAEWARACSGTGACLAACDDGINPRFMLAMARRALAKREPAARRRDAGKLAFQAMSRGVRVLSRLQLPGELLERLSPSSHPERDVPPELVFYTGCNVLRTPHIALLCLDVLDRLGVSYEVHGGPASCCGILQQRPGDDRNAGRQGYRTIERFAATGAPEVLSWCPTCQIQLGETALPSFAAPERPPFRMTMFAVYLERRLDALRAAFTHRVAERVALHAHPGAEGVADAVRRVLAAIPGLEIVDLDLPQVGYMLNSLRPVPEFRRRLLATELARAESAGVTTLAGVYHADHRELCAHESEWPFRIVNFMELVGAALGIEREDLFKRLKRMRDVDAILVDTAELAARHGLEANEVREVVARDLLGEQHLPVDRREHPRALGHAARSQSFAKAWRPSR